LGPYVIFSLNSELADCILTDRRKNKIESAQNPIRIPGVLSEWPISCSPDRQRCEVLILDNLIELVIFLIRIQPELAGREFWPDDMHTAQIRMKQYNLSKTEFNGDR